MSVGIVSNEGSGVPKPKIRRKFSSCVIAATAAAARSSELRLASSQGPRRLLSVRHAGNSAETTSDEDGLHDASFLVDLICFSLATLRPELCTGPGKRPRISLHVNEKCLDTVSFIA